MYHNHFDNAAKTYTILDGYWFSLDILHTDNWYHYEPKTNLLEKKIPHTCTYVPTDKSESIICLYKNAFS